MATILTNYEDTNDDFENAGSTAYHAMGFKIPSSATCTSVSIWGSQGLGVSGTTAFEIYSGAAPDSTLVKTETFTTSAVLAAYDASPHWNEITFTASVALTSGTQYYLRVRGVTGSVNDEYRWATDTTSGTYPDGTAWVFNAAVWTQQSTRYKNFRINGNVASSGATTSNLLMMGVG